MDNSTRLFGCHYEFNRVIIAFNIVKMYIFNNQYCNISLFRLIRDLLIKQKFFKGDDLKKLTDTTNENVKKISIVEHETKEVSVDNFIRLFYFNNLIFYYRKSYDQ